MTRPPVRGGRHTKEPKKKNLKKKRGRPPAKPILPIKEKVNTGERK